MPAPYTDNLTGPQARRPKTPKLACPRLAARVTAWLADWWSPQQIAARLRIEFPGDLSSCLCMGPALVYLGMRSA